MATIQFSNGQKVEFNGTPTEADIQHVVEQLGLNKPTQTRGEKGLQGFATGIGKSVAGAVTGAGTALQTLGTGITKAVLPQSLEQKFGVDQMGINALKPGTTQNQSLREALKAKGIAEKIGKTTGDIGTFIAGGELASAGTAGASKLAQIAGQVGSDVAVQSAQQGNFEGTGKQAVLTAGLSSIPLLGPVLGKLGVGKTAEKIATNIEKMNLRLSPLDSAKLAKSGDEVASFLAKEKIVGNPEQRFAKVDELYNKFEGKVQKILSTSGETAKRIKYSKNEVLQSIKNLPDEFLAEANDPQVYDQLVKDVSKFSDFVKKQKGDFIDASKINDYKRSYAKSARNKAGDVVLNDSREALADGLYNLLLKDNPELQKINNEYSKVILSRKLLGKALGRNELGLIGNLIGVSAGGALGSAVGGPLGAAAGFTVGPKIGKVIAGTKTRSFLGSKVQSLAEYLNTAKVDEAGNFIIPRSIINGVFGD